MVVPKGRRKARDPLELTADVAGLIDRILDEALTGVASAVVGARTYLRRYTGKRLPEDSPEIEAAVRAASSERRPSADGAPRHRKPAHVVTLAAGFTMPPVPGDLTHPSQRIPFQRGVAAAWDRAPSCPYGDRGLQAVCARAWMRGLKVGGEMRGSGAGALS
mgnify:CR=1 FL=1